MATIVTLGNSKYHLIEVQKGTKVPAGVEAIRWHDGKDYILSPVSASPAPIASAPVTPPAPVTTEVKERSSFPWWLAVLALILFGIVLWLIFRPCTTATTVVPPLGGDVVWVDGDCYAKAAGLGAPADAMKAICDPVPGTNGVSMRLTSGTKVSIGTITFDAEDRVWFLQDFVVPSMASYAFEYTGSERSIFDAPFVLGSELGWANDGTRVPFKICWDTTSEGCIPPTNLFPTK